MADRCRSCDALIKWALSPTGARIPLCEADVYWPVNTDSIPKNRDDLPDWVQAAVGSKPTQAYQYVAGVPGYVTKIGDFYVVKNPEHVPMGEDAWNVSRRLVSHYATCPQAGQWSGKGRR